MLVVGTAGSGAGGAIFGASGSEGNGTAARGVIGTMTSGGAITGATLGGGTAGITIGAGRPGNSTAGGVGRTTGGAAGTIGFGSLALAGATTSRSGIGGIVVPGSAFELPGTISSLGGGSGIVVGWGSGTTGVEGGVGGMTGMAGVEGEVGAAGADGTNAGFTGNPLPLSGPSAGGASGVVVVKASGDGSTGGAGSDTPTCVSTGLGTTCVGGNSREVGTALAASTFGFSLAVGCAVVFGFVGDIICTAAIPAIKLQAAAARTIALRRIDLPGAAGAGVAVLAAAAKGGFAALAGSGFGSGFAGAFAGASTAIGSIREPSVRGMCNSAPLRGLRVAAKH